MRKKILSIIACLLLSTIAIPSTLSLKDSTTESIRFSNPLPKIPMSWVETQKLLPSDPTPEAEFGFCVSLSGNTALIGEPYDDDYVGAAYVFLNTGDTWVQQAKLIPSDPLHYSRFGDTVALAGDTAIIGAPLDDDNGNISGSAYIFTRTGTTWTQQAKLLPNDGAPGDKFGCSVALYNDTAVIGAYWDDDNGDDSGSAYVFTRINNTWTQEQKLLASDGEPYDFFGDSVSLTTDTMLIGAPGYYWPSVTGYAYVFTRSGTTWTQQAKLLAPDAEDVDLFGDSVVLDGDTALIGATDDDDNGYNSGSVYVFIDSGGIWTFQQKLLASDGAEQDKFGVSVALSNDTALVGAVRDDDYTGSAYVFTRTGTTWTEQAKLIASDGAPVDCFADSVSLVDDIALIGSPSDDDNGLNSGSAYIFQYTPQPPDTTPPTTNITLSGTMGENDWYVSNVQATLTATDGKQWPSGVNHTYYKVDDGEWQEYTVPVIVDTDGYHTICYYSDDHAGNIEIIRCVTFQIDKTPPVISSYIATAQNMMMTEWLLEVTAEDATSGIVLVEFYADDTLVGDVTIEPYAFLVHGIIHTTQCLVYDAAGNSKVSDVVVGFGYSSQQNYFNLIQTFQQKIL